MDKKKIIIIVVFFVLALGVGGYFIWKKSQDDKDDDDEGTDSEDKGAAVPSTGGGGVWANKPNLKAVAANLGGGGTNPLIKPFANAVSVTFGPSKNKALFMDNDRIIIYDAGGSPIRRGKYLEGGKKLIMDNGVVAEGGSVWNNLYQAVK